MISFFVSQHFLFLLFSFCCTTHGFILWWDSMEWNSWIWLLSIQIARYLSNIMDRVPLPLELDWIVLNCGKRGGMRPMSCQCVSIQQLTISFFVMILSFVQLGEAQYYSSKRRICCHPCHCHDDDADDDENFIRGAKEWMGWRGAWAQYK